MVIADRKGCGKVQTEIFARNLGWLKNEFLKTNHETSTTPEEDAFITYIDNMGRL